MVLLDSRLKKCNCHHFFHAVRTNVETGQAITDRMYKAVTSPTIHVKQEDQPSAAGLPHFQTSV